MNPLLCTSIDPDYPDFARSCMIIHDIDLGLTGSGISIDSDACLEFANTMSPKNYRYGVLDFPEIGPYLSSCSLAQAEIVANDFADALRTLSSTYPSVKWTLIQSLYLLPSEGSISIGKKFYRNYAYDQKNRIKFISIISQVSGWMCVDLRPDDDESLLPPAERLKLASARASCGLMLAALGGWSEGVFGCIGDYNWDPRSSTGSVDSNFPMQGILSASRNYGLAGMLHYHPASVVWRVHADQPTQDAVNGISAFSNLFDFNSAKAAIENQCSYVKNNAVVFYNLPKDDPREIVISKVSQELSGAGEINTADHIWHKINRSVNSSGYWIGKNDIPPKPNPIDFS